MRWFTRRNFVGRPNVCWGRRGSSAVALDAAMRSNFCLSCLTRGLIGVRTSVPLDMSEGDVRKIYRDKEDEERDVRPSKIFFIHLDFLTSAVGRRCQWCVVGQCLVSTNEASKKRNEHEWIDLPDDQDRSFREVIEANVLATSICSDWNRSVAHRPLNTNPPLTDQRNQARARNKKSTGTLMMIF